MATKTKNTVYIVVRGLNPGIYRAWTGENGAARQVAGIPNAQYKGFPTLEAAAEWLAGLRGAGELREQVAALLEAEAAGGRGSAPQDALDDPEAQLALGKVVLFTDGGCDPNPGPGGYGAVLLFKDAQGQVHRRELSGGFRKTTNNRMELLACIEGLSALKRPSTARRLPVVLYSDSQYVVNGITKGWARRWRDRDWFRTKEERAENVDLWARLLALTEAQPVEFRWVKGHAGTEGNERCDALATEARQQPDLPADTVYEEGRTQEP